MSEMISLPVGEIPDPDRRSLENLLGRPLAADQQVFVMVSSAGKVADDATRRAAMESIRRTLDQIDHYRTAHGISDEEVDAAVDAAMDKVRPRQG
jgi:hypothetical protein